MSADRPRTTAPAALLAASVITAALALAPTAGAAEPRCTITGTAKADVLRGTPGNDVICGLGGNDTIAGGGGNDVIRGDAGNDSIAGGAGNDSIDGGTGNDRASGDAGNDSVSGGAGNDRLSGGDGSDSASGGTGDDSIDGGTGNDRLAGGDGADTVGGVAGNDVLDGGSGSDQLSGGTGNDALQGGTGTDRIDPGEGADTCAPDGGDRVSGACTIDRTGPTAAWVDVPSTVRAGETFTATFSLKDPSSIDPNSPNVKIGGPPGWITTWCGDAGSFPLMASLVSGTSAEGVWSVTCKVPDNAVNDTYSFFVGAQDSFGNSASGLGADFTVTGGSSDNKAPLITDVVIPRGASPGETITLTWRAADPSGVRDTPYAWAYRPAPQMGVVFWNDGVSYPKLTSGTAFDGTWSQTIKLRANSVSGNYSVYISIRDELGNKSFEPHGSFTID